MYKFIGRLLLFTSLALLVGGGLLGYLIIDRQPLVMAPAAPSASDAARAKSVIKTSVNLWTSGTQKSRLELRQNELSSLFALGHRAFPALSMQGQISEQAINLDASMKLPLDQVSGYINAQVILAPSDTRLEISRVRLGDLALPGWLLVHPLEWGLNTLLEDGTGSVLLESMRIGGLSPGRAAIIIQPVPDLRQRLVRFSNRLNDLLGIDPILPDTDTIALYYQQLVQAQSRQERIPQSMLTYLAAVFSLAQSRSEVTDPIRENQAALLALALFLGDDKIEKLTGPVRSGPMVFYRPDRDAITLGGRTDLVRHFAVSAGLRILSDYGVAMTAGEIKELLDSNAGGSGFSFVDLAADRSGLAFAEMATRTEEDARQLQQFMSDLPAEQQLFPDFSDLPENMSNQQFRSRYGDLNDARYLSMVAEIDQRLQRLPFYSSNADPSGSATGSQL